jgi:hypothetical protein
VTIDPTTLFLFWFGGGFVLFLFWSALVGEALMGSRPHLVRPAIGLLAVLGLVHPVAGGSAIDLIRLSRNLARPATDDPESAPAAAARHARAGALALPSWSVATVYACALTGIVVAVLALVEAGGIW